jgi:hypothetical protein
MGFIKMIERTAELSPGDGESWYNVYAGNSFSVHRHHSRFVAKINAGRLCDGFICTLHVTMKPDGTQNVEID